MRILFLADIVGRLGRRALAQLLPELQKEHQPDVVIANGENAAGGLGLDLKTADEIYKAGVQIITGGNHTFSKKELSVYLNSDRNMLRPANYPGNAPGRGYLFFQLPNGKKLAVINLIGRVSIPDLLDCPFRKVDEILKNLESQADAIFVDFHAEATSEKMAMGHFLDGRVSVIVGTHTHVQTADERILEKGTAYITDVGMCGPANGVIGCDKDLIIQKFLTSRPVKFNLATGPALINGVIVELLEGEDRILKVKSIRRINQILNVESKH